MIRMDLSLGLLMLSLALAGGGCSEVERAPEREPPVAPSTKRVPLSRRAPLAERLAEEASRRPARAIRPERLFTRLEESGLELLRTRQVLAAVVNARYCEAALVQGGLTLSVCEFADAEAAQRGLVRSRTLFDPLFARRELFRNDASVLTITLADGRSRAAAERAASLFAALAPEP